jgi:hypothetical protein
MGNGSMVTALGYVMSLLTGSAQWISCHPVGGYVGRLTPY